MIRSISFFICIYMTLMGGQLCSQITPDSFVFIAQKRTIAIEELEPYYKDDRYIYARKIQSESNPLIKWMNRQWTAFDRFMEEATGPLTWTIIRFLIISLTIVLIVYHLSKSGGTGLLARNDQNNPSGDVFLGPSSSSMHLADLLLHSENQKDFKSAIRWNFLHALKLLEENGLVQLRNKSSNQEIVDGLENGVIKDLFSKMLTYYEYAWYGDYPIVNQEDYKKKKTVFIEFKERIINPV